MMMNLPSICLENVKKQYAGADKVAVHDVSLTLEAGQVLALLGPNGAGKTTTVKMIAGLITPTSGYIDVMGYDIVLQRRQAVGHIGAVLEGARNSYWRLSAQENLRYFGRLRMVPRKQLQQRIDELLAHFGLYKHRHKEVGQFSRGMQQKLAIAAALLHDPAVLLLDEPTLGLDVQAARQLEEQVASLAKERGKAILLTTHMMPLAEKLADSIFVIHQGQQVAYDTTSRLLARFDSQRRITDITVAACENVESLKRQLGSKFAGTAVNIDGEQTLISYPEQDQVELLQLLQILNENGLEILSVNQRRPNLEEIFLSLTNGA